MTFYTNKQFPNGNWLSTKTAYDPCPAGWRVPEGGENGVWVKALGTSSPVDLPNNRTNMGINFTGTYGEAEIIWYPNSGYRVGSNGTLNNHGDSGLGYYWSCSPFENNMAYVYSLYLSGGDTGGNVLPLNWDFKAHGFPVRCLQE